MAARMRADSSGRSAGWPHTSRPSSGRCIPAVFWLPALAAALALGAACTGLPAADNGPVLGAPPAGPYDVEITGIEVTQGTQNLANDIPVVAGRNTLVRVYARETTGKNVPDVQVYLYYSVGHGTVGGGAEGYGGLTAASADVRPDGGDRTQLENSFDFGFNLWMPDDVDLTSPGTLTLRAELNPATVPEDVDPTNDHWPEIEYALHVPDAFELHFVPIRIHNGEQVEEHGFGDGPNDTAIARSRLRYLPFADAAGRFKRSHQAAALAAPQGTWDIQNEDDWAEILDRLEAMRMLAGAPPNEIYYGMLPGIAVQPPSSGLASVGGRVAEGQMDQRAPAEHPWLFEGGQILGHELGHVLGLLHVNCLGEDDTDPAYPWPTTATAFCRLSDEDPDGYYGADVYYAELDLDEARIFGNALDFVEGAFPLMGYVTRRWISPWEYCKALPGVGIPCNLPWPPPPDTDDAPSGPHFTGPTPDPGPVLNGLAAASSYLIVGGVLDLTAGTATLAPFYLTPEGELPPSVLRQALDRRRGGPRASSGYRFSLEDAEGRTLHEQPVISGWLAGSGGEATVNLQSPRLILRDLLPAPEGVRWIRLRRGGEVVAERAISRHGPEVAWTNPPPGQALASGDVLRWQAADADGDTLSHSVLWSHDGGDSWTVLTLEQRTSELLIEHGVQAELRTANGPGLLRVITTDGVRTAHGTVRVAPPGGQPGRYRPRDR